MPYRLRLTMRVLLTLSCVWWIESSLAFVGGATESIALSSRGNSTESIPLTEPVTVIGNSANGKETTPLHKLWDSDDTPAFVSTLLSSSKDSSPAPTSLQVQIEWHTHNLLSFLEKLVASRSSMPLKPIIAQQMKSFVSRIASLYDPENPYHNFDHATHVSKSITQLLTSTRTTQNNPLHTIQSNPLWRFSLLFAALVHDVDHRGVPNAQLVQEDSPLARRFLNQSVAERNSIALAFQLLDEYPELKEGIGSDKEFRYWVTRAVLATDIADPILRADRNQRWDAVYVHEVTEEEEEEGVYGMDARTIIAFELLLQVADVAHTMQPGAINHDWNERLYAELKRAHSLGRAAKDPIEGWYPNELGFFDFYVLPLARKWEFCCGAETTSEEEGLFPSTSLVEQAKRNRQEWEKIGHGVVKEFVEKY